jgi:dTDP-4-amino-4,6-dideoxygalactose transaminase
MSDDGLRLSRVMTGRAPRAWRADAGELAVPVCKPKLPSADRLLALLREIDASRWYSNHGPLVRRFEMRLAEHVGASSADQVVVVANATAALTATLMAFDVEPGTLCMMPAWTFAASGHAAVQAGLRPWFVDVDPFDGALSAAAALRLAADAPGRLGAALIVSPFGRPVDVAAWDEFRRRTGIPVVLDAAAAFDVAHASPIPTVVSLHATKVLAVGEGAFVAWTDTDGVCAIRQRVNFGFSDSREARVAAINGKLSEYAAAVGLAALDEWPATRASYLRVAREYAGAFEGIMAVKLQPGYGSEWISGTAIVEVPADRLAHVEDALAEASVGSRRWWGDGLARHAAFASYARSQLPVTDALASVTLGLPCWPDLPVDAVARVAQIVAAACAVNR